MGPSVRSWITSRFDGSSLHASANDCLHKLGMVALDGVGHIQAPTAFDRKQYAMTKGIPFIKFADRVQVDIDLKGRRISGPPVTFNAK